MWSHIKSALRNLLHRQQVESELDAEIASYVAAVTDEKIASGLAPEEARRLALAECMMRHARLATTTDVYVQVVPEGVKQMIDSMNDELRNSR
jgi:hypothetical protein